MISYTCVGDLDQFGFSCLTGEACGLGMRALFDVSEDGKEVLARTLGLPSRNLILMQPWNGGKFNAGSVLLTYEMATTCAIFAMLLKNKCLEVWQRYDHGRLVGDCYGMETAEELELAEMTNIGASRDTSWRRWRMSSAPGSGDRNQHMISGRVS